MVKVDPYTFLPHAAYHSKSNSKFLRHTSDQMNRSYSSNILSELIISGVASTLVTVIVGLALFLSAMFK